MQSDGKKASYNPAATLASLLGKRERLQEELHNIEKQVYELETSYLQESSHFGNALKGFDGFLSASKNTTNLKRSRKFQPEDRIFSLSSSGINFPWTLEEWLPINQSKILETQVLPGPNIQCTQWCLTQEVRTIIGGILKSFKSIHEQFYVSGQLNTQNIMLSEGLDVKLTDVKLVRGNKASFKDDFSKLKEIIEKIIHNVASNGNIPKDVLHFMSFLGKPMDRWVRNPIKREDVQKMVMSHPMGLSQFCCVTRFDRNRSEKHRFGIDLI